MKGDVILSVQHLQHREVAELWWDGSTELIRGEQPERATIQQWEQLNMHNTNILSKFCQIRDHAQCLTMEGDSILIVQLFQHREVAELRRNGATELIRLEVPERATMKQWAQLKMQHLFTDYKNNIKSRLVIRSLLANKVKSDRNLQVTSNQR